MTAPNPNDYLILLEQGPTSCGAWSPDLPGCVAVGEDAAEALQLMREAIAMHLDGIIEDGDPIPTPSGPGVYIPAPAELATQAA